MKRQRLIAPPPPPPTHSALPSPFLRPAPVLDELWRRGEQQDRAVRPAGQRSSGDLLATSGRLPTGRPGLLQQPALRLRPADTVRPPRDSWLVHASLGSFFFFTSQIPNSADSPWCVCGGVGGKGRGDMEFM